MAGTLYTFPDSFRAHKILIAAQYSGKKVDVAPDFVAGETDKSAEFLKKFPFGKVPAYESGDVKLFETNGIAYYVGNDQTRGGAHEAEVLQWIGFADNVILPAACTWVYPTKGILQYNKQSTEKAKTEIKAALTALNDFLASRTFLVGERVTQADISLACTLRMLYQSVLDPEFRKPYGNVNRWFVTLVNQPQFKTVLGQVDLCKKMAEFDMKKYNEIHGKAEKAPKGKKGGGGAGDSKSPKPKKEEKAEEPAAQAAPTEKKDPWGHLPQIKYDWDAWKKLYTNEIEKQPDMVLKYFWDNFDKENFSIWRGSYKYNDEFKVKFKVSNLIRGFLQRLGKMNKNSFGSILILKKTVTEGDDVTTHYRIDSIWFWKGQDLAFELSPDWQVDYDVYDWSKLNPDDEATKKLVREYFVCEGDFDGWEHAENRQFK